MSINAPTLLSPNENLVFNHGYVDITWNSTNENDVVFEIQYTDNYNDDNTVWSTLKKRISSSDTSYSWKVGKMLKTDKARIRMRAVDIIHNESSDWSMSSGNFSINVYKLLAPAIVSPIPYTDYSNYILIIIDETLVTNTYNQKINYAFEYASHSLDVEWTTIINKIPTGQNFIRWDISGLIPANDYILRVTATDERQEQQATAFVYNLQIRSPNMVIIDTLEPEAVVQFDNNVTLTKDREQILNIYAEDNTSGINSIQVRECLIDNLLKLGNLASEQTESDCQDIEQILSGTVTDFTSILGKPQGFSSKIPWQLTDANGNRKLEVLLTDFGGNLSVKKGKTFLNVLEDDQALTDFVRNTETNAFLLSGETEIEVVYIASVDGRLWVVDPFPKLIWTIENQEISRIYVSNNIIYICTFNSTTGLGSIYSLANATDSPVLIINLQNQQSKINDVSEFNDFVYFGLENGELWQYQTNFVLLRTFNNPINSVYGDSEYLYIGFKNSNTVTIYNGSEFIDLGM